MIAVKRNVEISQSGRGGVIRYTEDNESLSFDWEFSTTGATVFVPTPDEWELLVESCGFADARGRREEILEFIAIETIRQKTSGARFEISDNWIEIEF